MTTTFIHPADELSLTDVDTPSLELVKTLHRLSVLSCSGKPLEEILDFIHDEFHPFLPYNRIGYAEIDRSRGLLVARYHRSDRPIRLSKGFSAPMNTSSLRLVCEQRRPRILNNLQEYLNHKPKSKATRLIVEEGFRSSLTCPLVKENQTIGVLFFTSDQVDCYRDAHVELFEHVSQIFAQHLMLAAEQQHSQRILGSCITAMYEMLGKVNQTAVARANRIRRIAGQIAGELGAGNESEITIAAILSQLGCIIIPEGTLQRSVRQSALSPEEQSMIDYYPKQSSELISKLPEMESVAGMVAMQNQRYEDTAARVDITCNREVALGASILKLSLDYDSLRQGGMTEYEALGELNRRVGWYDPQLLSALEEVHNYRKKCVSLHVMLSELSSNMVLADRITNDDGDVLVSEGQRVTAGLKQRLLQYAVNTPIREPIEVLCPELDQN